MGVYVAGQRSETPLIIASSRPDRSPITTARDILSTPRKSSR